MLLRWLQSSNKKAGFIMNILLVAIGGFLGSIARFYISVKMNKRLIGTWIANITGSIILAFLLHFHMLGIVADSVWVFLGVGFCGAYTTFSTFGNETLQLILDRKYVASFIYVMGTLLVSLTIVYVILFILAP